MPLKGLWPPRPAALGLGRRHYLRQGGAAGQPLHRSRAVPARTRARRREEGPGAARGALRRGGLRATGRRREARATAPPWRRCEGGRLRLAFPPAELRALGQARREPQGGAPSGEPRALGPGGRARHGQARREPQAVAPPGEPRALGPGQAGRKSQGGAPPGEPRALGPGQAGCESQGGTPPGEPRALGPGGGAHPGQAGCEPQGGTPQDGRGGEPPGDRGAGGADARPGGQAQPAAGEVRGLRAGGRPHGSGGRRLGAHLPGLLRQPPGAGRQELHEALPRLPPRRSPAHGERRRHHLRQGRSLCILI